MNEVISLLRTILASATSSLSTTPNNSSSTSSPSSSSSITTTTTSTIISPAETRFILLALLVASELVTRGAGSGSSSSSSSSSGGGDNAVRSLLQRLAAILDAERNVSGGSVVRQDQEVGGCGFVVEWTMSLLELTRSVAGRRRGVSFAATALPSGEQPQQNPASASAAALLIVTGDIACACRDSLRVGGEEKEERPRPIVAAAAAAAVDYTTEFNQAINETIARCHNVEDYRLVGLLRLLLIALSSNAVEQIAAAAAAVTTTSAAATIITTLSYYYCLLQLSILCFNLWIVGIGEETNDCMEKMLRHGIIIVK